MLGKPCAARYLTRLEVEGGKKEKNEWREAEEGKGVILKRDRYASLFPCALFLLSCSLYDCLVFLVLLLLLLLHPFLPLFVYFPPLLLYTRPLVSPRRPTTLAALSSLRCIVDARVQHSGRLRVLEDCMCESRVCLRACVYVQSDTDHMSHIEARE